MSPQPMGSSGVGVDIIQGRPMRPRSAEEQQADLELKEQAALIQAAQLAQELPAVLPIFASQLEGRLLELMKKDERCQGIIQMVHACRLKVEIAPGVVRKIRRQIFGGALNTLTDETKVAPEGIPTEE